MAVRRRARGARGDGGAHRRARQGHLGLRRVGPHHRPALRGRGPHVDAGAAARVPRGALHGAGRRAVPHGGHPGPGDGRPEGVGRHALPGAAGEAGPRARRQALAHRLQAAGHQRRDVHAGPRRARGALPRLLRGRLPLRQVAEPAADRRGGRHAVGARHRDQLPRPRALRAHLPGGGFGAHRRARPRPEGRAHARRRPRGQRARAARDVPRLHGLRRAPRGLPPQDQHGAARQGLHRRPRRRRRGGREPAHAPARAARGRALGQLPLGRPEPRGRVRHARGHQRRQAAARRAGVRALEPLLLVVLVHPAAALPALQDGEGRRVRPTA
mmetsp:Transcript_8529/g.25664  ORF Transcript_8529/g.25664 Transcript_8529/m.25664 type:complete len:328 (+) Transcript_8529:202-1185(+)